MSRLSPLAKRRALIALLGLVPLVLFAVIREKHSWQPRVLSFSANVGQVFWMPDGKTLLMQTSKQLQFWDANNKVLLDSISLAPDIPIDWLSLSSNGLLAYHSQSGCGLQRDCLIIWDLQHKKRVSLLSLAPPYIFSPDGKQIITGKAGKNSFEIRRFDVFSGQLLQKVPITAPPYETFLSAPSIIWYPSYDGKRGLFSIPSHNLKPYVAVFDISNGKHGAYLLRSSLPPNFSADFASDSKTLIINGFHMCELRDSQCGKLKIRISSSDKNANMHWSLFAGNEQWLFGFDMSGGGRDIFVWETSTGNLLRKMQVADGIRSIDLSPDGATLAVSTRNNVKLYRMR